MHRAHAVFSSSDGPPSVPTLLQHMVEFMGAVTGSICALAGVTSDLRRATPTVPPPLVPVLQPPPQHVQQPQQQPVQQPQPQQQGQPPSSPTTADAGWQEVRRRAAPRGRKTWADRVRQDFAQAAAPEQRRELAGKLLFARAPVERRLVHASRPLHEDFGEKVQGIEMVYVKGIHRMPFKQVREYLMQIGPEDFDGRHVLHLSYFGPVTAFMCVDSFTAERLRDEVSELDGEILLHFDPTQPLALGGGGVGQSVAAAEKAFCARVAREIRFSSNLLVGTYLYRALAPRLTAQIGALLHVSPRGHPARAAPVTTSGGPAIAVPSTDAAALPPVDGEMTDHQE